MTGPIVALTANDAEKCWQFARGKLPTVVYYTDRGQENEQAQLKQEYDGQMGNTALNRWLGTPDNFSIYALEDKHFIADAGKNDCKTCSLTTAKNYNGGVPSWTFQYGDKKGNRKSVDPVSRSTYLVLEVASLKYEIRALVDPETIRRIWTAPDKDALRGLKKTVRQQHIPEACFLGGPPPKQLEMGL